jgi:hypothetical protein
MSAVGAVRDASLALVLLTLAACGSGDDGPPTQPPEPTRYSLSGGWGATIHSDSTDVASAGDILFCLSDVNGVISGTGFVTDRQVALVTVTITGTYDPPHVVLTLNNPESVMTIDGTIENDPTVVTGTPDMVGSLSGWVFDEAFVDLGWDPSCPLAPGAGRGD